MELLNKYKGDFDAYLEKFFEERSDVSEPLFSAMKYAVLNGGKRLRPALVRLGAEYVGGSFEDVKEIAVAVELIHSYSLVHDDLPAMDNDTLRRGLPTAHVKFGEGMAILAGDALLNLAYETLFAKEDANSAYYAGAAYLAKRAGVYGMIKGQCLDIDESTEKNLGYIIETYRGKTSGLIEGALVSGAVAAGGSEEDVADLSLIGDRMGLIFQIVDDILDVTSSEAVLGKNVGSDEQSNKRTYIALRGIEQSKRDVAAMEEEIDEVLNGRGERATNLSALVKYLTARTF